MAAAVHLFCGEASTSSERDSELPVRGRPVDRDDPSEGWTTITRRTKANRAPYSQKKKLRDNEKGRRDIKMRFSPTFKTLPYNATAAAAKPPSGKGTSKIKAPEVRRHTIPRRNGAASQVFANTLPSTSPRNGTASQVFANTPPSTSHSVEVFKSPPISWTDMCKSRKIREEFVLQYIEPKSVEGRKVIEITKEDVAEMKEYWKNTIVLYVLGNRPFYGQLRGYAMRMWKLKGAMDIYSRENGFFFVKFKLAEDLDRVLENGPWTFDGRLIVMRRWDPSIDFARDRLTTVPIWIRFPWLPPQLWSSHAIMKLASGIGKPLRADPLTARKERLSYARIFVEIIATDELVGELEIELPNGKTLFQKVEYEWVPPRCSVCKCFGHTTSQCLEILEKGPLFHEGTNKPADTTRLREEVELEGSLGVPIVTEEGGCDVGSSGTSREGSVLRKSLRPEPKVPQPSVTGQENQQVLILFQPSGSLAVPQKDSVLISVSSIPDARVGGKLSKKVRHKSEGTNPEDETPLQFLIFSLNGQLAEPNHVWETKSLQHFKIVLKETGRQSYGTTSYGRRSESNEKKKSTITLFSEYDIEGATNGLSDLYKIGQGRYGSVYRGYIDDTKVAIKVLDANSLGEFLEEALGRMRYPNLVKLIGACIDSLYSLILEFLPNGSLKDCLRENSSFLTWQMRTRIVYGMIGSFLTFLHSKKPRPFVHGDIKPSNILFDVSFGRKLSDFGLSSFLPEGTTTDAFLQTTTIKGSEWFLDPEFASDLYSYGVKILRLLTGKPANRILGNVTGYKDQNSLMTIVDRTAGNWPPDVSEHPTYFGLKCCRERNPGLTEETMKELGDFLAATDNFKTFDLCLDKNSSNLSSTSTPRVKVFSYLDIERATNGLSESSKIGQGAYGSVYKGCLDNTQVAIKILDATSKQGSEEFIQELEVLGQMRHPNLVMLIGACFRHHSLVYEFLPNGSLEDCLKNRPRLLTWQMRTRIIYEICSALIFLHSNKPQPVLHGDLKPANILLDNNFNIKLADFGLCRFLPEGTDTKNFHNTKNFKGTEWYIDPHYLTTGNLSTGCDVYSFGVTILRILTGASPDHIFWKVYRQYYERKSLMKVVDSTAGAWPDHVAEFLARNGLRCCDPEESSRSELNPEGSSRSELMMKILSELKNILDKIGS